jgi:hypothetical protein
MMEVISLRFSLVRITAFSCSILLNVCLGSPFTIPTSTVPVSDARSLKVRNHALTLLFETPFTANDWHNFAVQVDWTNRTLGVFYSTNATPLAAVTGLEDNSSAPSGVAAQGDYHFGVLKVSLNIYQSIDDL